MAIDLGQVQLSDDQKKAHDFIIDGLKAKKKVLTLGGYAGTGKTTLIYYIVNTLRKEQPQMSIAYCAFTGKAATVLMDKIVKGEDCDDYIGTIHSLIYSPILNPFGLLMGFRRKDKLDYDLIIVDEASMVNEEIFKDLKKYNIPLVCVGDHGQLPPVKSTFNLMENPMVKLEQIQRQAIGNPIIELSMLARNGEYIKPGLYANDKGKVEKITNFKIIYDKKDIFDYLLLSGTNATRLRMNDFIRRRKGIPDDSIPKVGETIICLKNNFKEGLYNGLTGRLEKISPHGKHWFSVVVDIGDEFPYTGNILRQQFGKMKTIREVKGLKYKDIGDLFDYGYCLTVHKAQGSESDKVILFDERVWGMEDKEYYRWLYTGITRAKKELIIMGK